MLILNFNRSLILVLLVPLILKTIKRSTNEDGLEVKAVSYFLNVIMKSNNEIKFNIPEYTIGIPSKIYDVAFTLNRINLLKDSVPQKEYFENIDKTNNENSSINRKIYLLSELRRSHNGGKKWGMTVYNAIEFEGKHYVEITLFHKKSNSEQIYCIEFYGGIPQKFYKKELVYD